MDEENKNSETQHNITDESSGQENQTNTSIVDIIDVIADRIIPLLKLFEAFFEQSIKSRRVKATFDLRMAWTTKPTIEYDKLK
ncbi:MAG: hypothetical protein GY865_08035 [candidate division Zixibacteria bacterium]|nr:hypothetical protein [candidate division Zixibacteria bacterium]